MMVLPSDRLRTTSLPTLRFAASTSPWMVVKAVQNDCTSGLMFRHRIYGNLLASMQ